jgi:hypothetical protein
MTRVVLYRCAAGHAIAASEPITTGCPVYVRGHRCTALLIEVDAAGRRRTNRPNNRRSPRA